MPYGKTPMKMNYDSPMKAGHSPMKMQGSWMSKHSSSALHMGHSPVSYTHLTLPTICSV